MINKNYAFANWVIDRRPVRRVNDVNTPRPDINNPLPGYDTDPLPAQAAAIRDELITATHIKWRNA
jgi:hypothetical protein